MITNCFIWYIIFDLFLILVVITLSILFILDAYALEVLEEKLKEGAKVLDVGSGTGYLTACFAIMVNIFKTSIKYNQAQY